MRRSTSSVRTVLQLFAPFELLPRRNSRLPYCVSAPRSATRLRLESRLRRSCTTRAPTRRASGASPAPDRRGSIRPVCGDFAWRRRSRWTAFDYSRETLSYLRWGSLNRTRRADGPAGRQGGAHRGERRLQTCGQVHLGAPPVRRPPWPDPGNCVAAHPAGPARTRPRDRNRAPRSGRAPSPHGPLRC